MNLPSLPPDLIRRRLLTALALSPLILGLGSRQASAQSAYQRIIALEWLPVELLYALGVTPLAVAEQVDYRIWVQQPALSADILDVGKRTEPNLELITSLKPDLILYSQGYGPRPEVLSSIAPAMSFSFSSDKGKPLDMARLSLASLAQKLGIPDAAGHHLADFDRQMDALVPALASYRRQPLLMFSLLDDRHVLLLGNNSLFQQVLDKLAIDNVWQGETNFWGSAIVGIERLVTLPSCRAIYFQHDDRQRLERVSRTPLWQAMPFIRENSFQQAPAVWLYGATFAALRFARVLEQLEGRWS